jgi:hypothetical protein
MLNPLFSIDGHCVIRRSRTFIIFVHFFCSLAFYLFSARDVCAASSAGVAQQERVIRKSEFQGRLVSLQWGDYLHANFVDKTKRKKSFFIFVQGLDYFLAANQGKSVKVIYEVVDSFIPEAGSVHRIERIVDVEAGAERYLAWWPSTMKKMSQTDIEKKFGPLVEKVMLQQ